jgi:glycylpeptide N-tetradecanoyltransferase
MFRFDYSVEFLKWALNPPGQYPEWLPVVRLKKN